MRAASSPTASTSGSSPLRRCCASFPSRRRTSVPSAGRPQADPLALSFQLKLLWLSGYLPHVTSCADCGAETGLAGYSARAGGAVCGNCASGALPLSRDGVLGIEGLLRRPLAEAHDAGL